MEFPHLGEHCSDSTCNRLDFLPLKCDSCSKIFCKDHFSYVNHNCESAYRKNVQVPVCPLCNQPVPVSRGQPPDIVVSEHIDRDCQSDPATAKRKVYSNKCSLKGCKQRELIRVTCNQCGLNFCLKHRHPTDHTCLGFQKTGRSMSQPGMAALARMEQVKTKPKKLSLSKPQATRDANAVAAAIQANMSEDEALALALHHSMLDTAQRKPGDSNQSEATEKQIEDDLMLARAIAASEQNSTRTRDRNSKSCCIS